MDEVGGGRPEEGFGRPPSAKVLSLLPYLNG
jgi:hypothetical protein